MGTRRIDKSLMYVMRVALRKNVDVQVAESQNVEKY
jgi:hypothetical protein